MENTSTGPVYQWYPIEEPIVIAYVEAQWQKTIYLSITEGTSDGEAGGTGTTAPLPTVTKYRYSWSGEQLGGVDVSVDLNGVKVNGRNVSAETFPAEDIEYQVMGGDKPPFRITKHAKKFSELPSKVAEMVRFIPARTKQKTFVINVTATLSNGAEMTAGFSIVIKANYSAGKASLQGAVNASRS